MQKNRSVPSTFKVATPIFVFSTLIAFAIPWWWRFMPTLGERMLWGAPVWFVTSVVGSALLSLATATYLSLAWQKLDVDDEQDGEDQNVREPRDG